MFFILPLGFWALCSWKHSIFGKRIFSNNFSSRNLEIYRWEEYEKLHGHSKNDPEYLHKVWAKFIFCPPTFDVDSPIYICLFWLDFYKFWLIWILLRHPEATGYAYGIKILLSNFCQFSILLHLIVVFFGWNTILKLTE